MINLPDNISQVLIRYSMLDVPFKAVWEGYRKGPGYVAVGVSTDSKMGEDIMFLCTKVGFFYSQRIYI